MQESQDYMSATPNPNKKKSFRETYYENEYKKLKDKIPDTIDQEITPNQDFRNIFLFIENTTEKLKILRKRAEMSKFEII